MKRQSESKAKRKQSASRQDSQEQSRSRSPYGQVQEYNTNPIANAEPPWALPIPAVEGSAPWEIMPSPTAGASGGSGVSPGFSFPSPASMSSPFGRPYSPNGPATYSPNGRSYSLSSDAGLDDVWKILFPSDSNSATSLGSIIPMPLFTTPAPTAGPSLDIPHQGYLHYYLNNVLPLQFRFTGSLSVGHLVAPLAVSRGDVLTSVASLAALHLSIKRNKHTSSRAFLRMVETSNSLDDDAMVAVTSQRDSLERLRFTSASDFTAEDVILSAMFACSFSTFLGGTSKEWREILALTQRCLSAALALSPELSGGVSHG